MTVESEMTDEEIDRAITQGATILEGLLDELDDYDDPAAIAYHIWADLTRLLAEVGWTPEELAPRRGGLCGYARY